VILLKNDEVIDFLTSPPTDFSASAVMRRIRIVSKDAKQSIYQTVEAQHHASYVEVVLEVCRRLDLAHLQQVHTVLSNN